MFLIMVDHEAVELACRQLQVDGVLFPRGKIPEDDMAQLPDDPHAVQCVSETTMEDHATAQYQYLYLFLYHPRLRGKRQWCVCVPSVIYASVAESEVFEFQNRQNDNIVGKGST